MENSNQKLHLSNTTLEEKYDAENADEDIPKDKLNLVYLLYYMLGGMAAVASDFYGSAYDYWMYKFRDPNAPENRTDLQTSYFAVSTTANNVSGIGFLIFAILVLPFLKIRTRICISMVLIIVFSTINLIFVGVDTDSWQKAFLVLTIISGTILNGATSFLMIPLFQLAAAFPIKYFAAQIAGRSACGVIATIAQIVALAVTHTSLEFAWLYFTVGSIVCVGTVMLYMVMSKKSEFFMHYSDRGYHLPQGNYSLKAIGEVLARNKNVIAVMIIVQGTTIALHPGVTSLVVSVNKNQWTDKYFVPSCTYLTYNIFDLLGRELATRIIITENESILIGASVLRSLIVVPLILLSNIKTSTARHIGYTWNNDYVYIFTIIFMAISNGYLVNISIIKMPKLILPEHRRLSFIVLFLVLGITLGSCSFLSILIVKIV